MRPRIAGKALLILVIGVLPWLAALIDRVGLETVSSIYRHEVFERVDNPGVTNRAPAWFYLPALLIGLLPGSLLLPRCLRARKEVEWQHEEVRARFAFLAGWAMVPPVLLSLSAGKEARYLIACFPAWALLLAWGASVARAPELPRAVARARVGLTWILPVVLAAVGFGAAPNTRGWVIGGCALLLASRIAFSLRLDPAGTEARRTRFALARSTHVDFEEFGPWIEVDAWLVRDSRYRLLRSTNR